MGRPLWHQLQVVAIFVERVQRASDGVTLWLDFCNLGARWPLGDIRISSGSCWYALFNGAREHMDMLAWVALGSRYGSRFCAPLLAAGCKKCVCSACSARRAHALICVPHAVPRTANTLLHAVVCVV